MWSVIERFTVKYPGIRFAADMQENVHVHGDGKLWSILQKLIEAALKFWSKMINV